LRRLGEMLRDDLQWISRSQRGVKTAEQELVGIHLVQRQVKLDRRINLLHQVTTQFTRFASVQTVHG
jgi:hypothetical protein